MKNNDINIVENNTEVTKVRKKQKAPLGVRPSDYLESRFKEEAGNKGLSQTELFERVFLDYLRKSSDEFRNSKLDCSLELQSVSGAATTLVKAIQSIISKSQDELLRKDNEVNSIKEATDKKIELATIELNNKIKELELINRELESKLNDASSIVSGFNAVKEGLQNTITTLESKLGAKEQEVVSLKMEIKERDKAIKSLEKDIDNAIKSVSNVEKEVALMKEEKNNLESRLASTQANNQMLQDTLNNFNAMKATEITAIKDNVENMSQLKISSLEAIKNSEIDKLNATIATLKESLDLKTQENDSLSDTYNNIVEAKEKELIANFNKEKAVLESAIANKNIEIEELKNALSAKEKANKSKERAKKEE